MPMRLEIVPPQYTLYFLLGTVPPETVDEWTFRVTVSCSQDFIDGCKEDYTEIRTESRIENYIVD